MTFTIPAAHKVARTQATLTLAQTGTGSSKLQLFATPVIGVTGGAAPLAEIVLTNTVGAIDAAGVLTLAQATPAGDLISTSGTVVWARWINRAGTIVGEGDMTDESGAGFFKLAGTAGTYICAGGLAILGVTSLG